MMNKKSIFSLPPMLVKAGSGAFVPNRLVTSLRLQGSVENAASTTYAESGFTMNDMFDPQAGSGAAQCVGFDQLALLYRRYRVLKAYIRVRASLNSDQAAPTATALEAQLVVYPSNVTTAASTAADGMSQPYARTKFFSGEYPANIDMAFTIANFVGDTVSADRLQALITASPASILYWHVGVISRAYTNIKSIINVTTTYDVEFFERALLDRSSLSARLVREAYLSKVSETKRTVLSECESKVKDLVQKLEQPKLTRTPLERTTDSGSVLKDSEKVQPTNLSWFGRPELK